MHGVVGTTRKGQAESGATLKDPVSLFLGNEVFFAFSGHATRRQLFWAVARPDFQTIQETKKRQKYLRLRKN